MGIISVATEDGLNEGGDTKVEISLERSICQVLKRAASNAAILNWALTLDSSLGDIILRKS